MGEGIVCSEIRENAFQQPNDESDDSDSDVDDNDDMTNDEILSNPGLSFFQRWQSFQFRQNESFQTKLAEQTMMTRNYSDLASFSAVYFQNQTVPILTTVLHMYQFAIQHFADETSFLDCFHALFPLSPNVQWHLFELVIPQSRTYTGGNFDFLFKVCGSTVIGRPIAHVLRCLDQLSSKEAILSCCKHLRPWFLPQQVLINAQLSESLFVLFVDKLNYFDQDVMDALVHLAESCRTVRLKMLPPRGVYDTKQCWYNTTLEPSYVRHCIVACWTRYLLKNYKKMSRDSIVAFITPFLQSTLLEKNESKKMVEFLLHPVTHLFLNDEMISKLGVQGASDSQVSKKRKRDETEIVHFFSTNDS